MDFQSCSIYGSLIISSILFAWLAQKKDCKKILLFIVLSATLVAGLRAVSVGIDTRQYTKYFRLLKDGDFEHVYGLETSFMYLCSGLMKIFQDEHVLFAIFAALTHGLVLFRLWDFKEKIILPWAVSCYLIMFYPESLNVMRQLVAIAFVFYGTRYISQKKYINFFVFVAIAFLFHNSALLGIGFLVVDFFFQWRTLEKTKKKKLIKAAIIVMIVVTAIAGLLIWKGNIIARYKKYFTNIRFNFGIMLYAKFMFLLGTIVLMHREIKATYDNENGRMCVRQIQAIRFYYGVGIILTSLGYIIENSHRIGWYFGMVECVYFGLIVKKGKYRRLFQVIIGAILLYTFLSRMIKGSNGVIPYLFFWQS